MFDSEEVTEASGWLNRNVVGLAINRFLSDFGHEAGTAILPLFLTAIGAPAIALGLIEGVADALSSFAKLFGGWLGDRVERRRPWAAAGYLLTGLTTGLYGIFPWWPWTLIVRTVGWAGRGLRSPLHDALLTDSVPVSARGRAFGFDEAADTAGAVAGPLAALAIVSIGPRNDGGLHSFSVIFWRRSRYLRSSRNANIRFSTARLSRARSRFSLPRIAVISWASSSSDAATSLTRC
jgi:hypothetical protein